MISLFSNLYLTLQAQLAAIQYNGAPALKMISLDTGQLLDEEPPLQYPCVLMDFDDASFSQMGENCQMGEVNIKFTLVKDVYSSTSSITNQVYLEKSLTFLELENALHQVLQGYNPSNDTVPVQEGEGQPDGWGDIFGSLDRVKVATNKTRADLRIRELVYSLGFEDYSTYDQQTAPLTSVTTTETFVFPTPS